MRMKLPPLQVFGTTASIFRRAIYRVLYTWDSLRKAETQLFILSYHSIASDNWRFSVKKSTLIKQIAYLKKRYDIVTLSQLELHLTGKKKLTKPSVVLTFDDGYADITLMEPFFTKHGITPTLFVLTNTKAPNWKELATKRAFLDKRTLKRLAKKGWEIGSHSATHANLATVSESELKKEIITSKKQLEQLLGSKVTYFAYPRGKYNQTVLSMIRKAPYRMAVTMDDGKITNDTNRYRLPRIGVDGSHTFSEFTTLFSPSVITFRRFVKESPVGRYL
jgi:peptidoglycan/xylan/chitin deacetylase (PgdA/CDA1 family)